ncbi:MAG: PLP-dependent aminotransferase family protein [Acidobacteriota bacterium]
MIDFQIDRDASIPLADQVVRRIETLIARGELPAGERLPSSRQLASSLGVSRNTVVLAYERLLDEGWVEAGVGRGTFVAERSIEIDTSTAPFAWNRLLTPRLPAPVDAAAGSTIDFAGAVPSADSFPVAAIQRAMQDVLAREGAAALGYGPPAGYRPLREAIVRRLRAATPDLDTSHMSADQVLIVNGSQHGLDLLARLLLRRGESVAVESPTYANALQLWRLHGARLVPVPMDADGIEPRALRRALLTEQPKLLYLMPSFQNPTGRTMTLERRREVLAAALETRVPVFEDHFDAELRYRGRDEPSLAALDRHQQVVQIGTFSKILCPGFRLGWILAPPALASRLLDLKRVCDLTSSLPAQMALAELFARGEIDRHLEQVRRAHGERLDTMIETITTVLGGRVTVQPPLGGVTVWLGLPPGVDAEALAARARRHGVSVAPGTWFDGGRDHIRLSFVAEPPQRIRVGVERLATALEAALDERRHPSRHETAAPFV